MFPPLQKSQAKQQPQIRPPRQPGRPEEFPDAAELKVYRRYLRSPERCSSSDWLEAMVTLPQSRILKQILHPLLSMSSVAFVISVLHCCCGVPGLPSLSGHVVTGSGLSLLLVFRTNSSYQRFQEGRKIWNDILDLSRDISQSVALFAKEAGKRRAHVIRYCVQAFPFAMQEHVRAKTTTGMQHRLRELLEDLHDEADEVGLSVRIDARIRNRPLEIINQLLLVIKSIPDATAFSNRERVWLLGMVTKLSHTVGRCERLVQTPVPRAYARHTSRFLSIWLLTLPLALVTTSRWTTAPAVFVIAWALLSILEIGHDIEDPFRRTIELSPISEAIYFDCARALGN